MRLYRTNCVLNELLELGKLEILCDKDDFMWVGNGHVFRQVLWDGEPITFKTYNDDRYFDTSTITIGEQRVNVQVAELSYGELKGFNAEDEVVRLRNNLEKLEEGFKSKLVKRLSRIERRLELIPPEEDTF